MNQTGKIEFSNRSPRRRLYYFRQILYIVLSLASFSIIPLVSSYWGEPLQVDYESVILFLIVASIMICSEKTLASIQIDYQARVITVEYIWVISPIIKRVIPFEHLQIKLRWQDDDPNTLKSIRISNLRSAVMDISEGKTGLPGAILLELRIKLEEITEGIATANTAQHPTTSPSPAQGSSAM